MQVNYVKCTVKNVFTSGISGDLFTVSGVSDVRRQSNELIQLKT